MTSLLASNLRKFVLPGNVLKTKFLKWNCYYIAKKSYIWSFWEIFDPSDPLKSQIYLANKYIQELTFSHKSPKICTTRKCIQTKSFEVEVLWNCQKIIHLVILSTLRPLWLSKPIRTSKFSNSPEVSIKLYYQKIYSKLSCLKRKCN